MRSCRRGQRRRAMGDRCFSLQRDPNRGLGFSREVYGVAGDAVVNLTKGEARAPALSKWLDEMREAGILNDGHVGFATSFAADDLAAAVLEARADERRNAACDMGLVLESWGIQHADKIVAEAVRSEEHTSEIQS